MRAPRAHVFQQMRVVLVHTGTFWTDTHHTTPQQLDHNTTRRQRKKTETGRQCGGAWLFSVDGVLCLVHPVNDPVFGLLNSVKYDSSLIPFSALAGQQFFDICELFILCSCSFSFFWLA